MTWGFDYLWKVADLQPWQLALGGSETWHQAHMAMYHRHRPDIIWYSGAGSGPEGPQLIEDQPKHWLVRDGNTGDTWRVSKVSYLAQHVQSGYKTCDPAGDITSREDVDRLIPEFQGWGDTYLHGLTRLINELGDRALVLPNYCTSYIAACYTLGFDRAMTMMKDDPALFTYLCDRHRSSELRRMQELADAGCQAVLIADAWASCDIISPAMFERFALPYQRSFAESCIQSHLRSILWNEGDVEPILELEAALPYDAFTWEQPRKGWNIPVSRVRETFGPARCLMGNLDSEGLLARANPDEIASEVRRQIAESGNGNPFIISTGSPLPSDTDPDAVDALLQASLED